MGNWSINVQGVGCHHNNNPEIDADSAAKRFVDELVKQGHTIESATFITGGKTSLMPPTDRHREVIWRLMEAMQGQIASEIRVMLGESAYDQRIFTQEERDRRITAMKDCAANSTGDADRHESWTKMHFELGWVYGEEFNPQKKTHPNLLPWGELPASTRSKARIFDIVAKTADKLFRHASGL